MTLTNNKNNVSIQRKRKIELRKGSVPLLRPEEQPMKR
jgi:hypothetical protein